MKKLLITLGVLSIALIGHSQDENKKIYLDEDFKRCDSVDASYFQLIEKIEGRQSPYWEMTYFQNGQLQSEKPCMGKECELKNGEFSEYHPNGKKKANGIYQKNRLHGLYVSWYDNGQIQSQGKYETSKKTGIWEYWYESGTPFLIEKYDRVNDSNNYSLDSYWNKSGQKTVTNGTGHVDSLYENPVIPYSTGKVKDGKKTGEWKGFNPKGRPVYIESYVNDKVKGTSWDKNGQEYTYTEVESQPLPKRGMRTFLRFVQNNIYYPIDARKAGVEGRVFVQFVVDTDGKLTNVKTIKGIGSGCDEEAERVIARAKAWKPAIQRGRPVKVKMVLPVTFKLSNSRC